MGLPPSGPLPEPVSWLWEDMEQRVTLTFSGPLQAGTLDPSGWYVRRLTKILAGLTVNGAGNKVTINWSMQNDSAGGDVVYYNDVPHDLRAYDGRWLPEFAFLG